MCAGLTQSYSDAAACATREATPDAAACASLPPHCLPGNGGKRHRLRELEGAVNSHAQLTLRHCVIHCAGACGAGGAIADCIGDPRSGCGTCHCGAFTQMCCLAYCPSYIRHVPTEHVCVACAPARTDRLVRCMVQIRLGETKPNTIPAPLHFQASKAVDVVFAFDGSTSVKRAGKWGTTLDFVRNTIRQVHPTVPSFGPAVKSFVWSCRQETRRTCPCCVHSR